MREKGQVRPSQWIALIALTFGVVIGFGAYWLVPIFSWWAYALLGLAAAAIIYDQWLKMVANEKIIDRGDWPTK